MAIEAKDTSAEARRYVQGSGDSLPSQASGQITDHPASHRSSEKTVGVERGKGAAKTFMQELKAKWKYITAQEGFRRAPLLIILRLTLWRVRCLLRWPATISLRGSSVRLSLPARWRG